MNKIERSKKFGLLLIGLLTFQLMFSQENYIPGYVIKNNTDTLFGFVDYRNWEKNPSKIKFKTNIENNPFSFKPTDITEFKVENEIYVSGIIKTEVSPIQTAKLKYDLRINIKVDTTFLQTLIKGKKSLYYYKNSNGRENFYLKKDTGFDLLIYKRYLRRQDGKSMITENRKYLGQLTLYLYDCGTINSKLETSSYNNKGLIKLFQYYYKCSPSDITFQKVREKIHTEIGILAGVSMTFLEFRSLYFSDLVNASYNPSVNLSGGLFFDFILPRNQRKWSICNELLFTNYKVIGEHNYRDIKTTTEIGYSYIKINNLVRFKYPIGQWFLFLNGGISNGFSIRETNYKRKELINTTTLFHEGLALNVTRKHEKSFILGIGLKYNKLSLEIRYENGNGMSEYLNLNSLTRRYYCLLGYRF